MWCLLAWRHPATSDSFHSPFLGSIMVVISFALSVDFVLSASSAYVIALGDNLGAVFKGVNKDNEYILFFKDIVSAYY